VERLSTQSGEKISAILQIIKIGSVLGFNLQACAAKQHKKNQRNQRNHKNL
jgi:hypothetical protein